MEDLYEEIEDPDTPPEAVLSRRAKSYSDFYDIVREHVLKDAHKSKRRGRSKRDKSWDALALPEPKYAEDVADFPSFDTLQDELLEASQQEYLYVCQLAGT